MFWADELASTLSGAQVVNDSKTPSGTVHVGSLRGVVLHDAIARALRDHGLQTEFRYGVDDLDPMDSQALLTPDAVDRYMGVPLAHVPAPEGSTAGSYARYFVGELFMGTFAGLGIEPIIYWMSELYGDGSMDPYIRTALDHAQEIRQIYSRVSHVEKAPDWLPLSVICENCGKIGTTLATDWNGSTVAYACKPDHVAWATGCGHTGRVLPTSGRVKLPFNVDWAAKWSLFDITVEGCGKDLATAGGSRDRSDAVAREVFQREPPLNVPYEFLNIGGKKMSTSKGTGATAHAIAELLPPELLRFLFLRHKPRKAIEFDPEGDTIPGLFDESDRIAAAVAGQADPGRAATRPRAILRQSLVAGRRGRRARGRPIPAGVPPPGPAGPGARRRPRGAHGGREGRPARRDGAGHPRRASPGRRGVAGVVRARPLQGRRPGRAAGGRGGPDRGPADRAGRHWRRRQPRHGPRPGTPGRTSSSARPRHTVSHPATPSRPSTSPSLVAAMVPGPAGCWPVLTSSSCSTACGQHQG